MFQTIVDKIKKIISKNKEIIASEDDIKYQEFINNIIPNTEFGDIVWAQRYDFEWEEEDIEESHKIGPYIIVDKTEDKLIGIYCTSVSNKKDYFRVDNDQMTFNKMTFATFNKTKAIDYIAFSDKQLISLSKNEKDNLLKRFHINKNLLLYEDIRLQKPLEIDTSNVTLNVGDIINDEGPIRLVIYRNKKKVFLIDIQTYNPITNEIDLTNEESEPHVYSEKIDTKRYIGSISQKNIEKLKEKYKPIINRFAQLDESLEKFIIRRGLVICKDTKYYYVYNINGDTAQMFPITLCRKNQKDSIVISSLHYIPNIEVTEEMNIKDKTYKITGLASEKEIDQITERRNNYFKLQKKQLKDTKKKLLKSEKRRLLTEENLNRFKTGSLLQSEQYFAQTFIVLGIIDDAIITISYDRFINNKVSYYTFYLNDDLISDINPSEEERLILSSNIELFTELLSNYQNKNSLKLTK